MKRLNKQIIFSTIAGHRNEITRLGISRIGLFGSYVRNQQRKGSDIDIYVEFADDQENFDNFINLCFLLDDLFEGKKVEVITQNGLSPYIGPHILKEVEYVEISN